ncbi:hypothetical protein D3C86_580950 [compost metagenome]
MTEAANRLTPQGLMGLGGLIGNLHVVRSGIDLQVRRLIEVLREPLPLQRRRHDHEGEIGAGSFLKLLEPGKARIGFERPLVKLVEDDQ